MNTTRWVQITIRGRLSRRLASTFDGMTASDVPAGTCLAGTIADQAQLHGLLAQVRDLGLELDSLTMTEVQPRTVRLETPR
jgi:hypothetical protein